MSDRDDLIVAGANALIGVPISGPGDIAVAVIDAVESLIVAAERERTQAIIEELENHIENLPRHTLTALRAKVAALPSPFYSLDINGEQRLVGGMDGVILRADVVALIDGSSNAATD